MNRTYLFVSLTIVALLLTPSCAKKKIDTAPTPLPSSRAETQQTGTDAAGSEEPARQGGIGEGNLLESDRDARSPLSRTAVDRAAFENEDIHFEFDSAVLTVQAQQILKGKVRWLKDNPGISVTVEGHCDDRGTNEYNLALGERRAQSAQKYLVTLGVDESRLERVSYGEERLLASGTSEAAQAKNRRVHFVISK